MLLADRLGPDWLVLTVDGVALPLDAIGPLTIRHGRDRVDSQPGPPTLSVSLAVDGLAALPSLGDPVTVELGPDAVTALGMTGPEATAAGLRFTGDVTDLAAAPTAGVEDGGLVNLTAVGRRARLARVPIDSAAFPAEIDGARAARILALAAPAAGMTVGPVDAGAVEVLAAPPAAKALAMLEALAADADALLVERRRDGTLAWQDRNHRTSSVAAVELAAADVLAGVTWAQTLSELVTALAVLYGPAGDQLVEAVDPDAVDRFGEWPGLDVPVTVQLVDAASASAHAWDLVARRAFPRWRIERLPVELLRTTTEAQAVALLGLEVSDLVAVTGFPSTGPHATAQLLVEGWTETIARTGWRIQLAVSDAQLTAASIRWADVDPALTWADVDPTVTWQLANRLPRAEPAALGRWLDQPANLTWSDVDPAATWAAYTT